MEQSGFELVVGIDEAGRGPLAGPVVAAAVILHPERVIAGLGDSKKLSETKRERLFDEIIEHSHAYGIGRATAEEIDQINILQATFLAMQRAVQAMPIRPHRALVDGNCCPDLGCPAESVIKGDQKIEAIMAASILAKVTRDREMRAYDEQYPGYGFAKHKGYGTKQHLEAIHSLGPVAIHRQSFAPIKSMVEIV